MLHKYSLAGGRSNAWVHFDFFDINLLLLCTWDASCFYLMCMHCSYVTNLTKGKQNLLCCSSSRLSKDKPYRSLFGGLNLNGQLNVFVTYYLAAVYWVHSPTQYTCMYVCMFVAFFKILGPVSPNLQHASCDSQNEITSCCSFWHVSSKQMLVIHVWACRSSLGPANSSAVSSAAICDLRGNSPCKLTPDFY